MRMKVRLWRCGPGKSGRCWLKRLALVFIGITLLPVVLFRWVPPPTSAVMVYRALAESARQEYRWVPMERIAPVAALAVVAAEDQAFPDHFGFDLAAIEAALERSRAGGRLRGASTITQQVAKNLFLWDGRSWVRKGLEAWYTLLLEIVWTKERILEVYLNIAEMGERTFGVEAASRRFFRRPAAELTPRQAAMLAAALPNPRVYRADAPLPYLARRREWILRQMEQLGGPAYLAGIVDD
jgi:monofunctional biosynthetic peptidoglycan transglycosylase